jgi:alpha-tubulin suppressor-like RCC1 family protein
LNIWKQVSVGQSHTVAIRTNGTLWSWGRNADGQLGLGNTVDRSVATQVGSLSTDWKLVIAYRDHTLAIKFNGSLWAWGDNFYGQLGLGDTTSRSSPVQVGSLTNWKSLAIGGVVADLTAVIKNDGTLWGWGRNAEGQLGLGNIVSRSSPVQVGLLTNWKQVSLGFGHTIGIQSPDLP